MKKNISFWVKFCMRCRIDNVSRKTVRSSLPSRLKRRLLTLSKPVSDIFEVCLYSRFSDFRLIKCCNITKIVISKIKAS